MLILQYEYEETYVRGGHQLLHTPFFQTLCALACDLKLDRLIYFYFIDESRIRRLIIFLDLFLRLPNCVDGSRWSWFRRYCAAVRAATGLMRRTPLPDSFISEVAVKIAMTSYYW